MSPKVGELFAGIGGFGLAAQYETERWPCP